MYGFRASTQRGLSEKSASRTPQDVFYRTFRGPAGAARVPALSAVEGSRAPTLARCRGHDAAAETEACGRPQILGLLQNSRRNGRDGARPSRKQPVSDTGGTTSVSTAGGSAKGSHQMIPTPCRSFSYKGISCGGLR